MVEYVAPRLSNFEQFANLELSQQIILVLFTFVVFPICVTAAFFFLNRDE